MIFSIVRKELVEVIRQKAGKSRDKQREHVQEFCAQKAVRACRRDLRDSEVRKLKSTVATFCSKYFQFLGKFKRYDLFFKSKEIWLKGKECLLVFKSSKEKKDVGRPSVSFTNSAPRTQRNKINQIGKKHTAEEMLKAAEYLLRKKGNEAGAKIINYILNNPEKTGELWETVKNPAAPKEELSTEEAVSLIIDGDFSRSQYALIRNTAVSKNSDIFPSYHKVLEEKKNSLPPPEALTVTDNSAEIDLKTLLDMDAQKIIYIVERKGKIISDTNGEFVLTHKWGCDGSGNHPLYRQAGEDPGDRSMLLTAQVPLQLKFIPQGGSPEILWQNPAPCSTKFCKPIRIQQKKETKDTLLEEERYYENKMQNVISEVNLQNGHKINIKHNLKCTMIDGKTRTFLTGTSSHSTCCACGATPVTMSQRSRPVDKSVFKYGVSVLHCRIRFLECVLHVSYKLEVKKWSCNASLYSKRKFQIQEDLRKELGILVDMVQHGSGSTNDGNTARKFFENTVKVSSITGFDKELLDRFHAIQTAIACSSDIDPSKFHEFCLETANRFEELYPWFYMPASVHFILIHGSDIISSLDLPLGMYSEEALEASNKNIRSFREHHTRKCSRRDTMNDLFLRLLLNGDVLYSSLRFVKPKLHCDLPPTVLSLLKNSA